MVSRIENTLFETSPQPTPADHSATTPFESETALPVKDFSPHSRICDMLSKLREYQVSPMDSVDTSPQAEAERRRIGGQVVNDALFVAAQILPPGEYRQSVVELMDDPTDYLLSDTHVHEPTLAEVELVLHSWGTVKDPDLAIASGVLLSSYRAHLDQQTDIGLHDENELAHLALLQETFRRTLQRSKGASHADFFNGYRNLQGATSTETAPTPVAEALQAYSALPLQQSLARRVLSKLGFKFPKPTDTLQLHREISDLEMAYTSPSLQEALIHYFNASSETPYDSLGAITSIYERFHTSAHADMRQYLAELTGDAAEKAMLYSQTPTDDMPETYLRALRKDMPNIRVIYGVVDALDIIAEQPERNFEGRQREQRLLHSLEASVQVASERQAPDSDMLTPVQKALKQYDPLKGPSLSSLVSKYAQQLAEDRRPLDEDNVRRAQLAEYNSHLSELRTSFYRAQAA